MNNQSLLPQNNIPLESLPKTTLCEIITSNLIQIGQLTNDNNILHARIDELEKDKENYYDIINQNKTLIKQHEENIQRLIDENALLKSKIASLEIHIDAQDDRITSLEKDIQILKNRDEPITIREGIVSLEKYIMMEILNSKTKSRSFHSIKDLFKDAQYKTECDAFLSRYNITKDHINLISEMKDNGNRSAHVRPVISRNDFETIALSYLSDDDDKNMALDLLKYLEIKNPHDPITGLWTIQKPY